MIDKRLTRNEHGEPVLTIRVVGCHDIYRLSKHLLHGQVEFGEVGRRSLRSLRTFLGRERYESLDGYYTGRAFNRPAPDAASGGGAG